MAKLNSTPAMIAITSAITVAIIGLVHFTAAETSQPATVSLVTGPIATEARPPAVERAGLLDMSARADDNPSARPDWAASATGRVETSTGEHRLTSLSRRQIVDVVVETHDRVKKGDPLVILDSRDLRAKRDSALAEVEVRLRERAEEAVTGLALDRQKAEDRVADAEGELFDARRALDDLLLSQDKGTKDDEAEKKARERLSKAEKAVIDERAAYDRVAANPDLPKPTRLDTGLTQSRADLRLVENEIEKSRVRAPFDGDVLNVWAKVGEIAAPSPSTPLILFGDKTEMRVRAELEERDLVNVRVGQKVVVRTDAHPGKDFVGKVTSMGGALGARNIATRGPRRPSDIDVLEVIADLGDQPSLLPGMRVDVFFANDKTATAN